MFTVNAFAQLSNVKDTVFVTIPFNSSQTFSDTLFNFGNIAVPIQWSVSNTSTIAPGHSGISICAFPGGCYPFDNTVHSAVINTSTALVFLLSWQVNATAMIGSKSYVIIHTNIDGGKDIVWDITVEGATSSLEEFDEETLHLFPIPVADVLNLETTGLNMSKVEISTVFGKMMRSIALDKTDTTQIPLTDLPTGTYFVCIYDTDNKLLTRKKFVKQ